MDFALSPRAEELRKRLEAFMDESIYPNEALYHRQIAESGDPHVHAPILDELKAHARERGLWNLFLPHATEWTEGLSNLDYAPLAEITGRSHLAPEALNCAAPDTGNMELLTMFATDAQKERWLRPLLEGEIRSCFAMTEPEVASSDATNISLRIERDGDDYVLNGRKWWISGAARERCRLAIVMGKTDPGAPPHRQQSMILVPTDTPGLANVRSLPVFGYDDNEGHCELVFDDVRVPADHLLGEEGGGFAMAQARLGPGRIHHCMRAIGVAERALELMCRRGGAPGGVGEAPAAPGGIPQWVADSRCEIDQARLMVLHAAHLMDTVGNKVARKEIAMIKVVVPNMTLRVIDWAIQAHGAGGVTSDFPLAQLWAGQRTLRIADGPDEVHRNAIAKLELGKYLGKSAEDVAMPV